MSSLRLLKLQLRRTKSFSKKLLN